MAPLQWSWQLICSSVCICPHMFLISFLSTWPSLAHIRQPQYLWVRSEMTSPKIKLSHSRYIAKVLSLTNLLSLWIWFVLLSRVPMRKVRALTSALVKLSHSNWSLSIILYIFSPLGPHDSYFYKRVLVRKGCTLSLSKFSWRSQVLKKSRLHSLPLGQSGQDFTKTLPVGKGFCSDLEKTVCLHETTFINVVFLIFHPNVI